MSTLLPVAEPISGIAWEDEWLGQARDDSPWPTQSPDTVADQWAQALVELGVTTAFGIGGGGIAPLAEALHHSPIRVLHCRHEGGAAFAATEASLVSDRPTVVFTTLGPGLLNALTGMMAARVDGAKVLLFSAVTPAAQRGRGALQETSSHTLPLGLFSSGPLFDYATMVEMPAEIPTVLNRLAQGLGRAGGFVAHIGMPATLLSSVCTDTWHVPRPVVLSPTCAAADLAQVARYLTAHPSMIWVGFGARHAAQQVRMVAVQLGALVMATPRGKGIFPEDHPQYLGVTGFGGHARVKAYLQEHRPAYTLVLGSRLGELSSFWESYLVPTEAFLHVDIDPQVFGAAYPQASTVGIHAEIGAFLANLSRHLPPVARRPTVAAPPRLDQEAIPPLRHQQYVRTAHVLAAVQSRIVERSDATVCTEAGSASSWGSHTLVFREPGRYRASTGLASMGHFTAGAVGAAAVSGKKVVALVGDGALLMNNEISTAVQYDAPVVWIVLNDSQYGMVYHGMTAQGFTPVETQLPETDFALLAQALGARGRRVSCETALASALDEAMAASGPYVVDVRVDPQECAPYMARINSLIAQGIVGGKRSRDLGTDK